MGRREWERGEILLPRAEWPTFKKALVNGYNLALQADFTTLVRLHAAVKEAIKGKRGVDLDRVIRETAYRKLPGTTSAFIEPAREFDFKVLGFYETLTAMLKRDEVTQKHRLQAPKKQALRLAKANTPGLTYFYPGGEASIALDNEKRTLTGDVPESKNACLDARRSHVAEVLFEALGKVKWGRGSGGSIQGNDEYHQDAGKDHAGGGGSYLKERFGPLGDQDYERVHGMPAPKTVRSFGR